MPKKLAPKQVVRLNLRLAEANAAYVEQETKAGRFPSMNA
jgi:hypothetical protein